MNGATIEDFGYAEGDPVVQVNANDEFYRNGNI